jgi:hypothetical protein
MNEWIWMDGWMNEWMNEWMLNELLSGLMLIGWLSGWLRQLDIKIMIFKSKYNEMKIELASKLVRAALVYNKSDG